MVPTACGSRGYQPSGWHGYIVKPMILQGHRQVCKGGGAETLSVNMQIFGYSPLKIRCTEYYEIG